MSCRLAIVGAIATVACAAEGTVVVEISARATEEVVLAPAQSEPVAGEGSTYRWVLSLRPDHSQASVSDGDAVATLLPDVRGAYVAERWLQYGLADRLTHQFVIHARGTPPVPIAHAESSPPVGATLLIDGTSSHSPEQRALTYHWRLVERPRDSSATLLDQQQATTSFVADVAGDFVVELAVFDGELWSAPHATITISAQ